MLGVNTELHSINSWAAIDHLVVLSHLHESTDQVQVGMQVLTSDLLWRELTDLETICLLDHFSRTLQLVHF